MVKKKKSTLKKVFHISGIIYYIIMIIFMFVTMYVLSQWYVQIQQVMDVLP